MKAIKLAIYLTAVALLPVFAVWLPFLLRVEDVVGVPIPPDGMETIASNFDGPLYIVIAKSFYNLPYIAANFSFPLPLEYYAAHFPMYPLIIRFFAFLIGFPWGMLMATLAGSLISIYYFYLFIRKYVSYKDALWLTAVFAVLPARWLIVRSVGAPETLFVGSIIASMYHFNNAHNSNNKKEYWLAGLWGAVAQLTKSPAILLFLAYFCTLFISRLKELVTNHDTVKWVKSLEYSAYPLLLIPLSLLGLFYVYSIRFNDFFAYFNSGDNIHLFFPPFQIFDYSQPWVNTHWLEEIIFIYIIGILGVFYLIKKKHTSLAWFAGIFFSTVLFVSHRDILRYSLPVLPFFYVAFSKLLTSKEFKIVMVIIILPIYLFTLAFIANNTMPIADWQPLL